MPKFEPQDQHRFYPQEQNAMNPVWCDVTLGQTIPLYKSVSYLWILRADNHLILGVENLNEYPELCPNTQLAEVTRRRGRQGHPTLAYDGSKYCEVMIGGELGYSKFHQKWVLNNDSGRYGIMRGHTNQEIYCLLLAVRNKFAQSPFGIIPEIRLMTQGSSIATRALRAMQRQLLHHHF